MHSMINSSFSNNDTSNEPNGGSDFRATPADIAIAVSIIDGISILFGATVNLVVIRTIVSHHRALKIMDLFILNLCLSGLVSSVFYQPLVITRLLARNELNRSHTKVLKIASFTCLLGDCAALFLITFDKYLGIRFPFRYHIFFSKRKVIAIISCVWVTAIAIGLTFGLSDQASRIAGILYGVLLVLLFVTTAILQLASFFIAKRHERRIQQMEEAVNHNDIRMSKPGTDNTPRANEVNNEEVQSGSTNNPRPPQWFTSKAARTITLLTMVFIISWLPQIVLNVYFMITLDRTTFHSLIYLFVSVQQLHVCINPFIYVFRTKCIRKKFFGPRNETEDI